MRGVGIAASIVAATPIVDALLIEPESLVVDKIEVTLAALPKTLDGFRIVQLSDFHYSSSLDGELLRRAVALAGTLGPDLVVFTGDYIDRMLGPNPLRYVDPCARILGELKAPLGLFAILGNHDHGDPQFISKTLESQGIAVLRNRAVFVEKSGAGLWIAGVDDVLAGEANLEDTLRPVPSGETTVLLAHEPDFADTVRTYPIDLQLSGHSHGGQIRLPMVGALRLPRMGRKYPFGLRKLGRLHLYTNRGLGTTEYRARFAAPPEVTLITLRTSAG